MIKFGIRRQASTASRLSLVQTFTEFPILSQKSGIGFIFRASLPSYGETVLNQTFVSVWIDFGVTCNK